jgi:hypothetical protein
MHYTQAGPSVKTGGHTRPEPARIRDVRRLMRPPLLPKTDRFIVHRIPVCGAG